MELGFSRVLVWSDFSNKRDHTVEEAAKISAKFNSELHLLHISSSLKKINTQQKEFLLKDKKVDLENRFGINIKSGTIRGQLQNLIRQYVEEQKIDLVVLNGTKKKGFKQLLFGSGSEKIMKTVNSEVLCVCPESDCYQFKKIVLPVEGSVPVRNIQVAYEFAKRFATSIHLVSLNNVGDKILMAKNTRILLETFRYLKDITNTPIECQTITGETIAEAAVKYAKKISADLILITAGNESIWHANFFSWLGNDIMNRSSISVLKVQSLFNTKKELYPI